MFTPNLRSDIIRCKVQNSKQCMYFNSNTNERFSIMKQQKNTFKIIAYITYILISLGLLVYVLISSKNTDRSFFITAISIWFIFVLFCIFKIRRAHNSRSFFEKGMMSVRDIDGMDGIEFEELTCDILAANDFDIAESTQASGDFGVDVLAEKDGITYAIQCKCYSGLVGIDAVQQVYAGCAYYDCHVAVVLTNQYYTHHAQRLADKIGVVLWDRDTLRDFL